MKLYIVYSLCLRCVELILSENVYDLYKMYHYRMMLKMCEIVLYVSPYKIYQ